ncbi:hypothetical protein T4D_7377 [Trichinella pseudospiralis]|uniref:Secreted protein n=1 Tax=Trichinella pseudospiralis TaxID=6337 RepID=A0A0V1F5D9_TRIPS|nr:hypothetical protein T4D_11248 [Trichinella pseudospiralis]KRY81280.1 hypothetical protein T4D_15609 [Trichinella pseudospiralis]KRY81793.1 hypothetical protein T4D_9125 [Trichinella pseudospiralis]KRY82122.1 hypothetical protein T4D_7377 [Trichinella pseudospiralis]
MLTLSLAPLLSHSSVGLLLSFSNSDCSERSQAVSWAACLRAIYSASVVDNATLRCFFDVQRHWEGTPTVLLASAAGRRRGLVSGLPDLRRPGGTDQKAAMPMTMPMQCQ